MSRLSKYMIPSVRPWKRGDAGIPCVDQCCATWEPLQSLLDTDIQAFHKGVHWGHHRYSLLCRTRNLWVVVSTWDRTYHFAWVSLYAVFYRNIFSADRPLFSVRLFLFWLGWKPSERVWWRKCENISGSLHTRKFLCFLHHGHVSEHILIKSFFILSQRV